MGLLDDAIRDHLDLKRRHGADPGEIDRAEREALGPVRRGPEEVGGEAEPPDESLEYAEEAPVDELSNQQPGHGEELPYDEEEEWSEWDDEPGSPPVPGTDAARTPEPPLEESEVGATQHPPPSEPFDHGEETAEYDIERELKKESEREGDEILEETPEFLQDTPEHDRLWFEQKPPRDFDFDG